MPPCHHPASPPHAAPTRSAPTLAVPADSAHPHAAPSWSAPRDARLRRLRREGATWAAIAAALGVTIDAARERGRRIGAPRACRAAPPPDSTPDSAPEDPARPPLPPGDPRAWGLLTAGTLLAGTDWPGWREAA